MWLLCPRCFCQAFLSLLNPPLVLLESASLAFRKEPQQRHVEMPNHVLSPPLVCPLTSQNLSVSFCKMGIEYLLFQPHRPFVGLK